MNYQLLNKSLVNGKLLFLSVLSGILLLLPGSSYGQSISFGVEFGTPQSNGGPCVGKGSCEQVYNFDVATGLYVDEPNAVAVTFSVQPATPVFATAATDTVTTALANVDSIIPVTAPVASPSNNVLTMSFSLSELANKQPDQVAYFTDASHSYQFDASCSLTTPIFSSLGLLPNASIEPTDETNVAINGDQVVVTIHYSYSSGKSTNNSLTTSQTVNKSTLSPNPVTDNLMLNVNSDDKISNYRITNLVGQTVIEHVLNTTSTGIDVSNLSTGMYLLNLFSGSHKVETIKFVKQ